MQHFVNAIGFVLFGLLLIGLSPFILLVCLTLGVMQVFRWVDLHGHFNGDTAARDRADWLQS